MKRDGGLFYAKTLQNFGEGRLDVYHFYEMKLVCIKGHGGLVKETGE